MGARRCRLEFVLPSSEFHDDVLGGHFHKGQWYWRFIASNGKELARSSETYHKRTDAIRSAELTLAGWGIREHEDHMRRAVPTEDDFRYEDIPVRWLR